MEPLEITDLIAVAPVRRDDAATRLRASGQERAARLVEALPAVDGVLDADHCRRVLLRIHAELQRLGEELQVPRRVADEIRLITPRHTVRRIVDVGCGTGYILRGLARSGALPGVELVATDFNADLVDRGRTLARLDDCAVRFEVADALDLATDGVPTVVISTGFLHHLDRAQVREFLARHETPTIVGFLHYDPEPGWLTNLGSWVFHRSRMREPISRHDGNLSMRRAHPTDFLLGAATAAAPSFDVSCRGGQSLHGVWRPLIGVRGADG
ncbi:class I SAM-dependent methyltransferase [Rhodococcus sp. NPDC058505]|uniref:class I SAM-dependent methyltransferase n=1 Tax=unclassified Rhodococcus (in: high G+C Gram-positive bacteria) TaxID=192944 RepID=UPI003659E0FB